MAGSMQGQAQDQASAMAAVTAAQTAAQAQAAANAAAEQQLAATQQQQAAAGGPAAAGAAPAAGGAGAAVPGLGAPAVPGLGGASTATAGAAPAVGSAGMSGPGMMSGQGVGTATGAAGPSATAGGSGMMASGANLPGASGALSTPASSLMMATAAGSSLIGHRHLMQSGTLGAAPATSSIATALPTTQLAPGCQTPIQGLVTGASAGVWVIPNYKGVASVTARGNDTIIVQLGGQGSSCTGAYKLLSGQVLGLGQPVQNTTAQAKPATSTAGSNVSGFWSVVAALSSMLLLWTWL